MTQYINLASLSKYHVKNNQQIVRSRKNTHQAQVARSIASGQHPMLPNPVARTLEKQKLTPNDADVGHLGQLGGQRNALFEFTFCSA